MTRIITEGFESGENVLFGSGSVSNGSSAGMTGNYAHSVGGATFYLTLPSTLTEFYWRHRFNYNGQSDTARLLMWMDTNGNELGSIRMNSSFKSLTYVGTTLQAPVGTISPAINKAFLLEVHVKMASSGGIIAVRIDGIDDVSFVGNTGTTPVGRIGFNYANALTCWIDDIAVNDINGTVDNSWCGDGYVYALTPNGNGDSSQLTGSDGNSTDNYLLVDETPTNNDTDYVESPTSGYYDLYNLTTRALNGAKVLHVWPEGRARDTVASGIGCQLGIKTSVEDWSSSIQLYTSYYAVRGKYYDVKPEGGEFTQTDIDNLQVGFKVV